MTTFVRFALLSSAYITSNSYCDFQVDLGISVQRACENVTQPLKFLYPVDISIKEKIEAIARSYGANGVEYSEQVNASSHLPLVVHIIISF